MTATSCGNAGEEHCCHSGDDNEIAIRQVRWLQYVTIAWMLLECAAALYAAVQARSLALLVFGSDSLVELLSASVVLLQFVPRISLSKSAANRTAAMLLFALAGAIICIAVLQWNAPKEISYLGIAVTGLALIAMPVLAWLKRRQARVLGNRALAADAAQSATCAYLAAVTLAGLVVFAFWRVAWIDTVAALAAVPIVIVEGRRARQGEGCGCV